MQKAFAEEFTSATQQRLAKRPDLLEFFSPKFGVGCGRLTPGPGSLEALCEDNVEYISQGIESINPDGVKTSDGRKIDVDILVCATNFDTSSIPPFHIRRKDGRSLKEKFIPNPETYLSIMLDEFPNLFTTLGANSAVGTGSTNSYAGGTRRLRRQMHPKTLEKITRQ
jgi:cation diffusion facilitator CzcD-associated flavoprotein CzcO